MAYSVFIDTAQKPGDHELATALGQAMGLWNELKQLIATQHAPLSEEWVHSGKNYGWSLRLKQKKRAVLYLTPGAGYFRVGLALGEKAVQAALSSSLPAAAKELIAQAPKYPEGRGVRMEIRCAEDIQVAARMAAIKMAS